MFSIHFETIRMRTTIKEKFGDAAYVEVNYEDLVEDIPRTLSKLHAFLGVEPIQIAPEELQIDSRVLSERIVNYSELRRICPRDFEFCFQD